MMISNNRVTDQSGVPMRKTTLIRQPSRLHVCTSNHDLVQSSGNLSNTDLDYITPKKQESCGAEKTTKSKGETSPPSTMYSTPSIKWSEDTFPGQKQIKEPIGRRLVMDLPVVLEED